MSRNRPDLSSGLLLVGKVIRPHGLSGLLRVNFYAGSEASFLHAETVWLKTVSGKTCECAVSSITPHKNVFLMKLAEIDSADEAEEYRGAEILVYKEALSRENDEFYWHELIGLRVYLETGECLGTISRILATGSHDIYVVNEGEKEVYIPAVYEVVKEVDIENGRMIVLPMEGLLDLNEV